MKQSYFSLLLLCLLVLFTSSACIANASNPVYGIISFTPTTINLGETVKLLAQVSFVQSGVGVQDVNFTWYVNCTEVLSENSTGSTLIYTPKTVGTYLFNVTVNGYSDGQSITVTVISKPFESPTTMSPTPSVSEMTCLMIVPLIVGMGIDNGVHILHRYLEDGRQNIPNTIFHTGRAVVMCTATTMAGFGSLVFSRYGGLSSMGAVANIGMITSLIAAIIVLPALLKIWKV